MINDKNNKDNKKNDDKKMDVSSMEVGEDATKYGEFISSYFAWVSLPDQKEKVEELEAMTRKNKKSN